MKFPTLVLAALFIMTGQAMADVKISDVHSFQTAPKAKYGMIAMTILNDNPQTDRLIAVSTPIATAELHQMTLEYAIARMKKVDAVDFQPGQEIKFTGNGYHIMLTKLPGPLTAGQEFPLTLTFEKAGTIQTKVKVIANAPSRNPMSRENM